MTFSYENASVKFCPQIGDSITVPYHATRAMQMVTLAAIILNCFMWPIGFAANVLVFITVSRKPQLRTVYNSSVLCLIATDLCVIVMAETSNIVYLLKKFITGDCSCSIFFVYNLLMWWCHGLSFCTLLVISIERYFAVFHPFRYEESMTKTRVFCVVVIFWIVYTTTITTILYLLEPLKDIFTWQVTKLQ